MKVHEFIRWLQEFPDQDATVEVIRSRGPSDQTTSVEFEGENYEDYYYVDFRNNPFVKETAPYYNTRTLVLGELT